MEEDATGHCHVERSMGRVSPVQLALSASAHGMPVLLRLAQAWKHDSARSFTTASMARTWQSPADTLCPEARGLSPQHCQEWSPRVCAAKPCFPCSLTVKYRNTSQRAPDDRILHHILAHPILSHANLQFFKGAMTKSCKNSARVRSSTSTASVHKRCHWPLPRQKEHGESEPRSVGAFSKRSRHACAAATGPSLET
eukprot:TRINITY_DN3227_c0_g2_i2.p1 TRINITY_DN3227_c0_g2~~TRINITY_DN3227_c0_g2_i2.p1  ORF type:complete len:197 (-),score=18.34 TRINITY_DN3227_c0_g2_i2:69-659(-)